MSAKTPGVAVLLTILWLGAGHLYAGRTGVGVTLLVLNFFLWLFLWVPFVGWLLAPLFWFPCVVVAAITSSGAVRAHNARWGIAAF